MVFAHILRRRDVSGGAKAGWIRIFILPLIGNLIYVIARPTMTEHDRAMAMSAAVATVRPGIPAQVISVYAELLRVVSKAD